MSADDKPREWWLRSVGGGMLIAYINDPLDGRKIEPEIREVIHHVIDYSAYAEAIRERDENHDQLDEALAALTSERAKLAALEARAQGLVEALEEMRYGAHPNVAAKALEAIGIDPDRLFTKPATDKKEPTT